MLVLVVPVCMQCRSVQNIQSHKALHIFFSICLAFPVLFGEGCAVGFFFFFFFVISLWSFILRFSTLFYLGVTLFLNVVLDSACIPLCYPHNVSHSG